MRLTDKTTRVPLGDIIVKRDERQRKKIVTDDLERSIAKRGLLNPIIIDQDFVLKAGERRLTACRNLGYPDILVRFAHDLDPIESQILELEENIKRQDLEWKEIIEATGTIHDLFSTLAAERGEAWYASSTGEEIGVGQATMSEYLRVWECFDDPRVKDSSSIREAYNKIKRRDQRAAGDALGELLGVAELVVSSDLMAAKPEASHSADVINEVAEATASMGISLAPLVAQPPISEPEAIIHSDFCEWAPLYDGPKFNFIHCDFPYGINLFAGPQGRAGEPDRLYDDDAGTYWRLLNTLLDNLDRVMSLSGHLMFWYSARLDSESRDQTRALFAEKAPSLKFYHYHLVWFKTDQAGIASDPRFTPRHVYETALLARRSDRNLLGIKSDCYGSPTDKRLHVSTKPEPMLRHFFEMVVDETTSILDPTCGSAAALRAADSLGAKRLLGLEIDPGCVETAKTAFRNARLLRNASSHI